MRVTIWRPRDGEVDGDRMESPRWTTLDGYEGQPLKGIQLDSLVTFPGGRAELYRFEAGGSFVMHSSPDLAFCQIVRGRGMLGLPGGRSVRYDGPELYVFLPGTAHEWHSITQETLLSVCIVEQAGELGRGPAG